LIELINFFLFTQNAGKILKGIFQLADAKIIYDKAIQNTYQSKPITAIDVSIDLDIIIIDFLILFFKFHLSCKN